MRRRDGFVRMLVVGALAALTLPAGVLLLSPAIGPRLALGAVFVVATIAALVAIAPDRRSASAAAAVAAGLGLGVLALGHTRGELAAGAALVLAVCRSGLLYRSRPLRAIALESALAAAGLALAALVAGPGLLGAALGVWSFALVQSVFFLVGGVRRRAVAAGRDAFETATARLRALLEEEPV